MMKKTTTKSKSLFLKFLPNPSLISPSRYHHHYSSTKLKAQVYMGFSGPINFSALPDEAQSKPKNGESFHAHEPTSPKVSCMGQIKQKHNNKKKKKLIKEARKESHNNNQSQPFISPDDYHRKIKTIGRFFSISRSSSKGQHHSKSRSSEEHGKKGESHVGDYPSLGLMRKYASGRETLVNFDWTAQIAPIDNDHDLDLDCYSDEDRTRLRNNNNNGDEKEIIIPFSAPILMGGGTKINDQGLSYEPRKEINIWKRRTMTPPTPLTLNSKVR